MWHVPKAEARQGQSLGFASPMAWTSTNQRLYLRSNVIRTGGHCIKKLLWGFSGWNFWRLFPCLPVFEGATLGIMHFAAAASRNFLTPSLHQEYAWATGENCQREVSGWADQFSGFPSIPAWIDSAHLAACSSTDFSAPIHLPMMQHQLLIQWVFIWLGS